MLTRRQALIFGAALGASGCTSRKNANGLSLWAMGLQGESAPRLMPRFEQATGLTVEVQSLAWTAAHAKLLTAFAGRSLPDVMMVPAAWLAELAMLGAVLPVPNPAALLDDNFDSAIEAASVRGVAYGAPWYADSWVQFYRPTLLEAVGYTAPPVEWDEWRTMALAIKRRSPDKFAVLALLDWPEPLFAFAAQQPERLLRDNDSRGNFRSAGFREALRFYKAIFDDRLAPAVVGREIGDSLIAFRDGYFAILPSSATAISDMRLAHIPDTAWKAAVMPGLRGRSAGLVTGTNLCVTRDARSPAAAWSLVRYLNEPSTQLSLYDILNTYPARQGVWGVPALADSPAARVFRAAIRNGVGWPQIPEWQRIMIEVQGIAEQLVHGRLTIDGAATAMDTRVDQLLEKRRWLLDHGRAA